MDEKNHTLNTTKDKIFCIIDGASLKEAFSFNYEPTSDIEDLRNTIRTSPHVVAFNDVAAFQFKLWKTSVSMIADDRTKAVPLHTQANKEELLPFNVLSKVFPNTLPIDTIHIIIERPPPGNMESKRELAWIADPNVTTLQDLRNAIFENFPDLNDDHTTITIRHPKQLNHPSLIQ
ncbi:hypothetical protein BGZ94_002871 [Podila epigama]|nr:hypothetical protein BGZ94_002871 [Podila epigama]